MYERALAIEEKALGFDHPDVAQSLNDLGVVLNDMGDYPQAKVNHERALAIREKALGPDHPDIATALNNVGDALAQRRHLTDELAGEEPKLRLPRLERLGPGNVSHEASLSPEGERVGVRGEPRPEAPRPAHHRA